MAIINCPNCNQKTTEISSRCPHCGFERQGEDYDRQQELKRRGLRNRIYHLKMTSYGVLTLFLAAFSWYWWNTAGFQQASSPGPLVSQAVCALAYVAIRIMLIRTRRQIKQISQ